MMDLTKLFQVFVKDRQPNHEGDEQDLEDLEVMAPKANIFRHIATEAQRMKHEYSLRAQIRDLARVNEAYILARINRAPDKATFLDSNTPETACEMFLLDRLLKANVEDVSGGVAP